jgi:hypothetical protein
MKFKTCVKTSVIQVAQWTGEISDIVGRYPKSGNWYGKHCPICGELYDNHGFMQTTETYLLCKGDFVAKSPDGELSVIRKRDFRESCKIVEI